ncbi:hypothetical protein CAL7716_081520 [Calothrix sp. PCC 7716]|nr:hypothetical protein CAL7716_081520 [Calothrix sp. PCC 7716]
MQNQEIDNLPNNHKNFFKKQDREDYIFNINQGMTYKEIFSQYDLKSTKKTIIHFPVNIAAEFHAISKEVSKSRPLNDSECPSKLLTVQMRLLSMQDPQQSFVYSNDKKPGATIFDFKLDFIPLQFFVEKLNFGLKILHGRNWYDVKKANYPTINIVIYCFEGKKTIFKLFNRHNLKQAKSTKKLGSAGLNEMLEQVKKGFINESNSYLHAGRNPWINQAIELPYLLIASNPLTNQEQKFKVSVEIIDICAIQGNDKDLSEIASNVNFNYKSKINQDEMHNLQEFYEGNWQRFLTYAKSQCIYYDILIKYKETMQKMYQELSIQDSFFKNPRLTIGSTVKNLLEAAILNKVKQVDAISEGEKIQKIVKELLQYNSPKYLQKLFEKEIISKLEINDKNYQKLKAHELNEKLLLTKVIGGRTQCGRTIYLCERNSNNSDVICYSDIKQAYPTVLKDLELPLGHLEIVNNITLKQYLKLRNSGKISEKLELVYVTVEGELPESQNFLPSVTFITSDYSDNNNESITKIYTHEVKLSPFTTSTFDWLEYVATPKLREYIYENGVVIIGGYYSKENFVPLESLHSEQNLANFHHKDKWTKVPLGEIIVNQLINKREQYKKIKDGGNYESEAMNNLLKLMANTIYGVLSSNNFNIFNSIVANNVTSDIRLMAWCMETALGAFQTITDGVSWSLNSVIIGKNTRYKKNQPLNSLHHLLHRLPSFQLEKEAKKNLFRKEQKQKTTNQMPKLKEKARSLRLKEGWNQLAIGNAYYYKWCGINIVAYNRRNQPIPIKGCQTYDDRDNQHCLLEILDKQLIPQHLKDCFPKLENFIDKFKIESKGLYTSITIDGMANYVLTPPDLSEETIIKRRSHNTKQGNGREALIKYYSRDLSQLDCVQIPMPYIDSEILCCADYQKHYKSNYQYSMLIPGDYENKVKSFQSFQISQFTFRTYEQYENFRKEHEKARNKYGLSTERYHWVSVDDEKTHTIHINYRQMLIDYDNALCPQQVKVASKQKFYKTYRSYSNGRKRNHLKSNGSLVPQNNPKEQKDKLNAELRRLFDYEDSYSDIHYHKKKYHNSEKEI